MFPASKDKKGCASLPRLDQDTCLFPVEEKAVEYYFASDARCVCVCLCAEYSFTSDASSVQPLQVCVCVEYYFAHDLLLTLPKRICQTVEAFWPVCPQVTQNMAGGQTGQVLN